MKFYADKNRSEREFQVGDWVFLRLQPYRQTTLSMRRDLKLAPKFYGPFKVLERIGMVAYRLQLPPTSAIHPVFHVLMLKKKLGNVQPVSPQLPPTNAAGQFLVEPVKIVARRVIKRDNKPVPQILVQWSNLPPEQATWEDYEKIHQQFPNFDP